MLTHVITSSLKLYYNQRRKIEIGIQREKKEETEIETQRGTSENDCQQLTKNDESRDEKKKLKKCSPIKSWYQ